MPEDPASIEHRAPAQSPPPERNYGGCLLPIGIAIVLIVLGVFLKKAR